MPVKRKKENQIYDFGRPRRARQVLTLSRRSDGTRETQRRSGKEESGTPNLVQILSKFSEVPDLAEVAAELEEAVLVETESSEGLGGVGGRVGLGEGLDGVLRSIKVAKKSV